MSAKKPKYRPDILRSNNQAGLRKVERLVDRRTVRGVTHIDQRRVIRAPCLPYGLDGHLALHHMKDSMTHRRIPHAS